jgi:hypothetical protein
VVQGLIESGLVRIAQTVEKFQGAHRTRVPALPTCRQYRRPEWGEPRLAVGCNMPTTPSWSKPSRQCKTARAERVDRLASVDQRELAPGSGHDGWMSAAGRLAPCGAESSQSRLAVAATGFTEGAGQRASQAKGLPDRQVNGPRCGNPSKAIRLVRPKVMEERQSH